MLKAIKNNVNKVFRKTYYNYLLGRELDNKKLDSYIDEELKKICKDGSENINCAVLNNLEAGGLEFAKYFRKTIACTWETVSLKNLLRKIREGKINPEHCIAKIYIRYEVSPYRDKKLYAYRIAPKLERYFRFV